MVVLKQAYATPAHVSAGMDDPYQKLQALSSLSLSQARALSLSLSRKRSLARSRSRLLTLARSVSLARSLALVA
jgi:hypothetical protein